MCSPDIPADFWPVKREAVSGVFSAGITKVTRACLEGQTGSGRKGRVRSGGIKVNHRAIQSLIHPSNSISGRTERHALQSGSSARQEFKLVDGRTIDLREKMVKWKDSL
jgi:hypothetical protein